MLDGELQTEPDRIREVYQVKARRIEPVGLVYLWPVTDKFMAQDPEQLAHQEWLGYVQPVGLVVSVPALLAAQAHVNRNIAPDHQRFLSCLPRDKHDEIIPEIRDLAGFTQTVLGWEPGDLTACRPRRQSALPSEFASLEVALPEYHETLRPTHAVRSSADRTGSPLADAHPGTRRRAPPSTSRSPTTIAHWQASSAGQVRAAAARNRRCRSACCPTTRTSGSSTPRAARRAAT